MLRYFEGESFPPHTLKALGSAFDAVCKELHDRGQPELVREVIAGKIIALAKHGETEPGRIAAQVLQEMGITRR